MRALIVKPTATGLHRGNDVTAGRWAAMIEALGHEVTVAEHYDGQPHDLLVALHALKSAEAVERVDREKPATAIVVALTGTDLYRDLPSSPAAMRSLERADRIVVLHPLAERDLPSALGDRVRTILQSVERVPGNREPRADRFDVCVVGHLREIKDPFRAAEASRLLPEESKIHVSHIGGPLDPDLARRARAEQESNPRYTWLGELPRAQMLRKLLGMRLLVLSSLMEGGANVVSEAVVHDVPVVASRIPGSVGLLGQDYPALFDVSDTEALAALLRKAETDPRFYDSLAERGRRLAPRFSPECEREAWRKLLSELSLEPGLTGRARE